MCLLTSRTDDRVFRYPGRSRNVALTKGTGRHSTDVERICLITPHHISHQPRAIREADLLSRAGYDVRVVARQVDAEMAEADKRLMETRPWRLHAIDLRKGGHSRGTWLRESLWWKMSEVLFRSGVRTLGVTAQAYMKGMRLLHDVAVSEPADWYIAHTQASLPAAAAATRRWGARLGFDCEDLLAENGIDPPGIVRSIEQRYIPACDYISVPSQAIAERLVSEYGIAPPLVLYNVFPLQLAGTLTAPAYRAPSDVLRLHWFGQTVGRGRGIEEAIEAAGLLEEVTELHLRGRISPNFAHDLKELAAVRSPQLRLIVQGPLPHDDLIASMNGLDVGLALERPEHPNYALTVTNKIFSYMLAGLAVAGTDTPGQREVFSQAQNIGFIYRANDPHALANGLRHWIRDQRVLRTAQQAAWDASRLRFCWDIEGQKLLERLSS
jgi:glycosyltransferase involved in cell wall biosynthesis